MPEWEKPFGKATLHSRSLPAHRESRLSLGAPPPWNQQQHDGMSLPGGCHALHSQVSQHPHPTGRHTPCCQ